MKNNDFIRTATWTDVLAKFHKTPYSSRLRFCVDVVYPFIVLNVPRDDFVTHLHQIGGWDVFFLAMEECGRIHALSRRRNIGKHREIVVRRYVSNHNNYDTFELFFSEYNPMYCGLCIGGYNLAEFYLLAFSTEEGGKTYLQIPQEEWAEMDGVAWSFGLNSLSYKPEIET